MMIATTMLRWTMVAVLVLVWGEIEHTCFAWRGVELNWGRVWWADRNSEDEGFGGGFGKALRSKRVVCRVFQEKIERSWL